ncbi:MAG: methylated-DNA--[protein]-cysteine S-methyltransferase [Alphaproteobacteria bacterium]|nr:methylated-DNA--[protein]-cysteine S-methyltransferase [Alphaproteobacteria bacterium]
MTFKTPLGKLYATIEDGKITTLSFWREAKSDNEKSQTLSELKLWLSDYFAGKNPKPFKKIAPAGTPFQQQVWRLATQIPYGSTATYGDIAKFISDNMSSQAVGQALKRNPIALLIPCHRVIAATALGGYYGKDSADIKQFLLKLEKERPSSSGQA